MAADELVAIVDPDNTVTGSATRARMRAENLLHRATYIFVFDAEGRLYVQHRTFTKDIYPGYWDLCAGGVVLAGESYEESAARELAEELGITGVHIDPWFDFYWEDQRSKVWGRAFGVYNYEGPIAMQAEEVQAVERLHPDEILAGSLPYKFTPDSVIALRRRLSQSAPA